jgi:hypothetical protein
MLLDDQRVTEEVRGGGNIKKFLESNENENMTYPNLWDTTKALLRRKKSLWL